MRQTDARSLASSNAIDEWLSPLQQAVDWPSGSVIAAGRGHADSALDVPNCKGIGMPATTGMPFPPRALMPVPFPPAPPEPKLRLVHQCCRLQRLSRSFPCQTLSHKPAKLVVHRWQRPLGVVRIAVVNRGEHLCELVVRSSPYSETALTTSRSRLQSMTANRSLGSPRTLRLRQLNHRDCPIGICNHDVTAFRADSDSLDAKKLFQNAAVNPRVSIRFAQIRQAASS